MLEREAFLSQAKSGSGAAKLHDQQIFSENPNPGEAR
jgi:hypothetical protein